MAERAFHQQAAAANGQPPANLNTAAANADTVPGPPPPYTPAGEHRSQDDADDDDEDDEDDPASPVTLIVNASNQIHGSNNLVPTSPTALQDASRFSAVLLQAINQINSAGQQTHRSRLEVNLTINCGVTIVGDRNVIGNFGVKQKAAVAQTVTGHALNADVAGVGAVNGGATGVEVRGRTAAVPAVITTGAARPGADGQLPTPTEVPVGFGAKRKAEDDDAEDDVMDDAGEDNATERRTKRVKAESGA